MSVIIEKGFILHIYLALIIPFKFVHNLKRDNSPFQTSSKPPAEI